MNGISRRELLTAALILSTGLVMGINTAFASDNKKRFAVISDTHVYDPSLGTSGKAYEDYLANDSKLLAQSIEIIETMIGDLMQTEELDFVLVPGDLTKDGEKICHEKFAEIFRRLTDNGIPVYVIPGNHDINNPHAVRFIGDKTEPVETVTPEEFALIHSDFGYADALYRHKSSLSYVAEPVEGVWLFAIDSSKYRSNTHYPDPSGTISEDTLIWTLDKLHKAEKLGKLPIGMTHHSIVPHFKAQPVFYPEFMADNYMTAGKTLSDAGLNIFFTGHFHAQDAAVNDFGTSKLYDVQTGSPVTAPCPYRVVYMNIKGRRFDISSRIVDTLGSMENFSEYKKEFIMEGMQKLYSRKLPEHGIDTRLVDIIAEIHVLHFAGDESVGRLSEKTAKALQKMIASRDPEMMRLSIALSEWAAGGGLSDNNIKIDL